MALNNRFVWLSKNFIFLSIISFLSSISTDILIPISGIFLEKVVGFTYFGIGIVEGISELTSGFLRPIFGQISDNTGRRVVFVRIGYVFGFISRLIFGLTSQPFSIFSARIMERFGKSVRIGAKDAMLNDDLFWCYKLFS